MTLRATRPAESQSGPYGPHLLRRRTAMFWLLAIGLMALIAVNLSVGAVVIAPSEVVAVLSRKLNIPVGAGPSFQADAVIWNIRLPRVSLGLVVGAGLGVAGAGLQGLFRNRLADPQLVGVAPGAALGAVLAIAALGDVRQSAIAGGIAGGVLAAMFLKRLGSGERVDRSRFVLIGVALGAVLSAWVGFVVFAADRATVPPVEFWLLGSATGATWPTVGNTALFVAIAGGVLWAQGRAVDVMGLGSGPARHLGVDVELTMSVGLIATGVAVGATVGATGVVGFVGLLAPHIARWWTGPRQRIILVGSALTGAALVVAADLAARTVASPIEIPVGLVTAALGGPVFVWMLRREYAT